LNSGIELIGHRLIMKNRFNLLTSKEWLPFQKSWFKYTSRTDLYEKNIRFFTKSDEDLGLVTYRGDNIDDMKSICNDNDLTLGSMDVVGDTSVQFAVIDLLESITEDTSLEQYKIIRAEIIQQLSALYSKHVYKRFVVIFIKNLQLVETYYPIAWDLAKHLSSIYSLKDEKIGCIEYSRLETSETYYNPNPDIFYCLYFKKDDNASGNYREPETDFFKNNNQFSGRLTFLNTNPSWFILKPPRRKKDEILHPAKYPEDLVKMFVSIFTKKNDNVYDPMSGTGSTQIGALMLGRNGYGTELSEFFAGIAKERCDEFINPSQSQLFHTKIDQKFKIICRDARDVSNRDFPLIDYLITSPPYWDMLNMKGAENQAKRKEKGLKTNYSEEKSDLGNIADYQKFITDLVEIYFNLAEMMRPGSYLTIIVKNIKKQGRNYPFAWDLSAALQKNLILLPEVFWCQDDISIAPYGYGNTFVTNTFHQYCMTFQKPK
jgi:DNA modification methylase